MRCMLVLLGCLSACYVDGSPPHLEADALAAQAAPPSELSAEQRLANLTLIRDRSRVAGLRRGALMGGIAQSETQLAHCWRDATWSCPGPTSLSCQGPIVAGASDGACAQRQGGLGMFQFDAGTYEQTLATYGPGILEPSTNTDQAINYVTGYIMSDVSGIRTRSEALAWLNSINMVRGDAKLEQWARLTACRYNGCCAFFSFTCQIRRRQYRDNALALHEEMGAAFW